MSQPHKPKAEGHGEESQEVQDIEKSSEEEVQVGREEEVGKKKSKEAAKAKGAKNGVIDPFPGNGLAQKANAKKAKT